MIYLLALILFIPSGNGLIMPMQKPDGTLDVSSLLSHIALLEQTIENKASTADTAILNSKLDTALDDLKEAQIDLKVTQSKLQITEDELKEVKSDLKTTQTEVAVLKAQPHSGQTVNGNVDHSAEIASLKSEVLILKSQCSCNATTTIANPQPSTDVTTLQTDVTNLKMEVQQIKTNQNVPGNYGNGSSGGCTFTRWGRTVCPADTKMVYKGYAGGAIHGTYNPHKMLCLPEHPIYAEFTAGNQGPLIYGTEYETSAYSGNPHFKGLKDEDVPCVVCRSESRSSAIMVPARNQCHPGWNLEYWGYLMGGSGSHSAADYICVDKDAEAVVGGHSGHTAQLLWLIQSKCEPLPCPPYEDYKELTCAVCSL